MIPVINKSFDSVYIKLHVYISNNVNLVWVEINLVGKQNTFRVHHLH